MNITFEGKVAIVTGGASGIGLACAELLAEGGAKAAIVDISSENLAAATKSIKKGAFRGYQLDVTNIPTIAPAFSRIRKDLGEVDILICSAGTGAIMAAEDISETEWDHVNGLNIKGLFFCNQAVAIQSMIPRKTGAIVNISSMFGIVAAPPPFMSADYAASKAGVAQLTKQLAVEWAQHNVRVNAVAPSVVITPMSKPVQENQTLKAWVLDRVPLRRLGTVEDLASAICFLASDKAKMITGVTLPVDGGWTAQ